MKPVYSVLIVAAVLFLQSCADRTPFYASAEKTMEQKKLLEEKFGTGVQYGSVVLMFDESSGNFITAQVKTTPQAKVTNWWTHTKIPRNVGRRITGSIFIAFGEWNNSSEELIEPGKQEFFGLNEIFWDKIPGLYAAVYKDMQQKGVTEPELKALQFSNYNHRLTGIITASTRGGGTSINYEFNRNGKLVNEPKF